MAAIGVVMNLGQKRIRMQKIKEIINRYSKEAQQVEHALLVALLILEIEVSDLARAG